MSVEKTLKERSKTHGQFEYQAALSQALKNDCVCEAYYEMPSYQREAIEMILHKIARIITGNNNFVDSWRDISGYSTLVMNKLLDEGALDVKQEYVEAREEMKKQTSTEEGKKEIEEALRDFFETEEEEGWTGKQEINSTVGVIFKSSHNE